MKVESPAVRLQLRAFERWTSLFGKLLLFVGLSVFTYDTTNMVAFVAMMFGPVFIATSYAFMLLGWRRAGAIEISGDYAFIHRGRTPSRVKLRNIASAYVLRGRTIRIQTRVGNAFEIAAPDEAQAHAVVEALGFGPRGRAIAIDLEKRSSRLFHVILGFLSFVFGSLSAFAAAVFAALVLHRSSRGGGGEGILVGMYVFTALAYAFSKRWFSAGTIAIGNDGIAVKQRLTTVRIPRSAIEGTRLAPADAPFVIARRGARPVTVRPSAAEPGTLEAAARECEQRFGSREELPRAATFERGSRDVGAWKAGIRTALEAGYRDAGASLDDARSVLGSPAATTEQRLGAALALRVAGEPPERIRIAAESAVDPRVQEAFEAIAEDEDDRLARTIRKMSR